jgi:hypothetical protein
VTAEERKNLNRLHLRVVNAILALHRFTLSSDEHSKALAKYEQAVRDWNAVVGAGASGQASETERDCCTRSS